LKWWKSATTRLHSCCRRLRARPPFIRMYKWTQNQYFRQQPQLLVVKRESYRCGRKTARMLALTDSPHGFSFPHNISLSLRTQTWLSFRYLLGYYSFFNLLSCFIQCLSDFIRNLIASGHQNFILYILVFIIDIRLIFI